ARSGRRGRRLHRWKAVRSLSEVVQLAPSVGERPRGLQARRLTRESPMKIAVFGATGGTGKNVVARALAAGHQVVAVARRPEAVAPAAERLEVKRADVLDAAAVRAALAG